MRCELFKFTPHFVVNRTNENNVLLICEITSPRIYDTFSPLKIFTFLHELSKIICHKFMNVIE